MQSKGKAEVLQVSFDDRKSKLSVILYEEYGRSSILVLTGLLFLC